MTLLLSFHFQTKCRKSSGNGTKKTEGFFVTDKFNEVKMSDVSIACLSFKATYNNVVSYILMFSISSDIFVRHRKRPTF